MLTMWRKEVDVTSFFEKLEVPHKLTISQISLKNSYTKPPPQSKPATWSSNLAIKDSHNMISVRLPKIN